MDPCTTLPLPCSCSVAGQDRSPGAAVSRVQGDPFCFYLDLDTSKDGDSTTVLGSLFQYLTTLSMKKFSYYTT